MDLLWFTTLVFVLVSSTYTTPHLSQLTNSAFFPFFTIYYYTLIVILKLIYTSQTMFELERFDAG